jgi:hypothetical protein
MSVDLDRQLREYCRDMDEKQGALSFEDILELTGELQVIPRLGNQQLSPRRRWIAAVAAAVAVLVVVIGIGFLSGTDGTPEPADTPPPPTTVAPDVESMTDLDVIEAGVAALYSGDAERAVDLFELSNRDDKQIRGEAAYQAAIGGRLTLDCSETSTPGEFSCRTPYHNAMTDAIGLVDPGDTSRIVVKDRVITEFAFPEHTSMVVEMGIFLATEGRFEGYEDCAFGPFPESCATIQLENLDAWVEGQANLEPADVVQVALESWYGGDCEAAQFISGPEELTEDFFMDPHAYVDCSTSSLPAQTIEYESILEAQVSVEKCEGTGSENLSCEVHYSNAMNSAVGKPPSVTVRAFTVVSTGWVRQPEEVQPWFEADYPEDTELRESFRLFAEAGELQDEYAAAGCASARTPMCASLILDNLDDWASWHETHS